VCYLFEHPICGDPFKRHVGRYEPTTDIDHIVPVTGPDDPLFWREDNHQPLCHACHSYKTATQDGGLGRWGGGSESLAT